jgi:DNA-binding SARP family transcriptional activator
MDVRDERARGNLRTAIWNVRRVNPRLLHADSDQLRLGDDVDVDLRRTIRLAQQLLHKCSPVITEDTIGALDADLLPDWNDEWVLVDRERLRQLRLHALEELCRHLLTLGRHADAVDTAIAVVAADPLRESAHRVLIEAHLAEHNVNEAAVQFDRYRELVGSNLGIEPSEDLLMLVMRALGRDGRYSEPTVRDVDVQSTGPRATSVNQSATRRAAS